MKNRVKDPENSLLKYLYDFIESEQFCFERQGGGSDLFHFIGKIIPRCNHKDLFYFIGN